MRGNSQCAASPPATQRARPWLVTAAAAVPITRTLGSYASFAQGLEDSGAAPGSASNRNQPLPASATRQLDAGLRWQVARDLTLVAGVFDLQRPYFQFAGDGRFTQLGNTRSRGLELSLAGSITGRLDILAGAVIGRTSVTGAAVAAGEVGRRALGRPDARGSIALEWQAPFGSGLRFNAALNHVSAVIASNDNSARAPARTTLDLGLRQALRLGTAPAQLRLVVTNIANQYGVEVLGSGVYDITAARAAQISLGVDF
jgi:iron complex outermembrane receptor protein